jgi:hypothetical protein
MTSDPAASKDIAPSVSVHAYNVQSCAGSRPQRIIVQGFALAFEIIVADDCCTSDRIGVCREYPYFRSERLALLATGADRGAPGNYPIPQVALRRDSRGIDNQQS